MSCDIEAAYQQAVALVRALCAIPAPSHHEEKRAEFCKKYFDERGFENVVIDRALNVLVPLNVTQNNDVVVIMAHTDTVFPDTEPLPFYEKDGFFYCPGVTDDTANLSVLMSCAPWFRENFLSSAPDFGVLLVANSCEEGLGNLKGCREIMKTYGGRIREFISLDSAKMNSLVTLAAGSHRYQVTVRTCGGHSYNDFGNPNAIHLLSKLVNRLYEVEIPVHGSSRTTYNVGSISGGTSVNTIAQEAAILYEYRSNDRRCLAAMQDFFEREIGKLKADGVDVEVKMLGERPCSADIDEKRFSELCGRVKKSVKKVLGLETIERSASTDCNIPLSLGIPAVCFGVCRGHGAHTREESLEVASLRDGCRLLVDFLSESYIRK